MKTMNKENVYSDNKLIAEFMGTSIGYGNDYYTDDKFPYKTSWDWLMPVLKKINGQMSTNVSGLWRMITHPYDYHIEDVVSQVVEFIKDRG